MALVGDDERIVDLEYLRASFGTETRDGASLLALGAGADDYVTKPKPFGIPDLVARRSTCSVTRERVSDG